MHSILHSPFVSFSIHMDLRVFGVLGEAIDYHSLILEAGFARVLKP